MCNKSNRHYLLVLCSLINAGNGIQAAGIANIRQALGYYLCQESRVISHIHIAFCVRGKLRLAASLSSQETECDPLSLS